MRIISNKFKAGPYTFIVQAPEELELAGSVVVSVLHGQEQLLMRTFYVTAANERHIRAFARKFASDAEYREASLAGTTHWARVERWFSLNRTIYLDQLVAIRVAHTAEERRAQRQQHQYAQTELQRLQRYLDRHIDELEATSEYQAHLQIEASTPTPTMDQLDPEIESIVRAFNRLPGVKTQFSCQGIRRGISIPAWEHGQLWFPGKHMPRAYIRFALLPGKLARALDGTLREAGVGYVRANDAEADRPEHNPRFLAVLTEFLQGRTFHQ